MDKGLTVDKLEIGQTYRKNVVVSEKMINDFALATGDNNPVHVDREKAKETFFGRRVAHGMLTAGIIGGVFGTEFPGLGTIYLSHDLKFLKPVFIGDELSIDLKIISIDLEKNRVGFETDCFNQHDKKVLTGLALVMPPE